MYNKTVTYFSPHNAIKSLGPYCWSCYVIYDDHKCLNVIVYDCITILLLVQLNRQAPLSLAQC